MINKFKYEVFRQNDRQMRDIDGRVMRETSSFLGLINKVDYTRDLGQLTLQPKFKSEYLRRIPFLAQEAKRKEWTGAFMMIARYPILQKTILQAGFEHLWLRDLVRDEEDMVANGVTVETGDLNSINIAVQLSNASDYMGYKLTTQVGLRYGRNSAEMVKEVEDGFVKGREVSNSTTSFITVYAGIQ